MLNFLPSHDQNCEGLSRRHFLQIGSIGGLGLTLPTFLAGKKLLAGGPTPSENVNCIMIWTRGGTSHHDTFDPKPNAPASVRGEFGVIDTAIPGIQFTEIVPNMAKNLDRFAVLRGWNPKNGSHGMADQYVLSGQKFNAAVHYPTYGSIISHEKGFKSALPPYVQLGTQVDNRFGGGMSGILGLEHSSFTIDADPNSTSFTVRDISFPKGVTEDRVSRRQKMLARIDDLQRSVDLQPVKYNALDEHYKAALNMITAQETKQAFKIEDEDPKLRDRYGRHKFGQSCLLARRLVESGVRFVTVTDGGWDTHQNNFKSLKDSRLPPVDQALPELLTDLEERGLLDTTLVCWFTDFGRTPNINSATGRDHWASAGFAIMAGAGIPGGSVLGATDEEGGQVVQNEYLSEDLGATIFRKLGLPSDLHVHAPDGRPVRLNTGRIIEEWC
ncbi:MAG: DUF1501 domain-containing protein [Planctomycetaceae bacterium]|jgi:hypothetical protein|nr:DUF1501 domain-containing protein [bacterium]MDC0273570.1 DUF1501 domain-containing protein [Planctomycetaceae bacterium]MDG2388103.1 DUF1501 domain-containing protein [Planctomycetaceae bacterium]